MKIKKISGLLSPLAKVLNLHSTSQNDTYSCDYINNAILENYSTEEQVIGKWIDGKPLYRRILTGNYGDTIENLILTKGDIDYFTVKKCIATMNTGGIIPIPYGNTTFNFFWYFDNDGLKLVNTFSDGEGATGFLIGQPYKCIVEYTKTTD